MNSSEMIRRAKSLVCDYMNQKYHKVYKQNSFLPDDFFIPWFCKTLQNWKAMVSTDVIPGIYFEVTYNGDRDETYIDYYLKSDNVCIKGAVQR